MLPSDTINRWVNHLKTANNSKLVFWSPRESTSFTVNKQPTGGGIITIIPCVKDVHWWLLGVKDGSVAYLIDSLHMHDTEVSGVQEAAINALQRQLNGPSVDVVTGAAAWREIGGFGGSVLPHAQAVDDSVNCGVYTCMYMWEFVQSQQWNGTVSEFRMLMSRALV